MGEFVSLNGVSILTEGKGGDNMGEFVSLNGVSTLTEG